jgi:hypothetical protein
MSTKVFTQVIRSIVWGLQSNGTATFLAGSDKGRIVTAVVTYYLHLLQVFYRIALAVFNTILLIP